MRSTASSKQSFGRAVQLANRAGSCKLEWTNHLHYEPVHKLPHAVEEQRSAIEPKVSSRSSAVGARAASGVIAQSQPKARHGLHELGGRLKIAVRKHGQARKKVHEHAAQQHRCRFQHSSLRPAKLRVTIKRKKLT